jgi:translation initiation factor 4G
MCVLWLIPYCVADVRFLGELFKKKLLSERIVHACIVSLLQNQTDPEECVMRATCA